jgi:general stress protein 26
MDQTDDKKKLIDALRAFDTLMVATHATNGTIHARPMSVAEVDDAGEVWFVTDKESHKVDEIVSDATALVTGQSDRSYVSMSGQLDVINDPERLAALWKSSWNMWFESGENDPRVIMLRLRPAIGEYWVARGIASVRYLFDATRAFFEGTTSNEATLDHAKVPL